MSGNVLGDDEINGLTKACDAVMAAYDNDNPMKQTRAGIDIVITGSGMGFILKI